MTVGTEGVSQMQKISKIKKADWPNVDKFTVTVSAVYRRDVGLEQT